MRLLTLVLVLMGLVLAPAASAAEPERADVVTHVFPETGHRVVAVALRYDEPLQLRRGSPARAAFTVSADGAPRTVVDVYSSPALPGDEWRGDARPGRYLIVELDPADANAAVNGNSADGATAPRDLDGAYTVTQTAAFRDDRGRTLTPPPYALENDGVVQPVVDSFERRVVHRRGGDAARLPALPPARDAPSRPARARPARRRRDRLAAGQAGQRDADHRQPQRARVGDAGRARRTSSRRSCRAGRRSGRSPRSRPRCSRCSTGMAASYRIDTDRVYLTGLSRGGRGAVEFLSNQPDRFAGSLLAAARAEDDDVSQVPAFVKVPLWLTHAIDDPVVPYQGSVDIANTLEAAGARVTRGTWAGDNSAGRAQDQAAEAAARRLLGQARATRSHTLFTTLHGRNGRGQRPLLVGADVRDRRHARLAVRAGAWEALGVRRGRLTRECRPRTRGRRPTFSS